MAEMRTIGAFAVIFNDKDQVLLVHRTDRDLWVQPGGGTENGERPWEAVIREVKEETGLDVEVVRLSGIYDFSWKPDIIFNFVCRVTGGELTLNAEARDLRYFSLDALPEAIGHRTIERILDAKANHDQPVLKVQHE